MTVHTILFNTDFPSVDITAESTRRMDGFWFFYDENDIVIASVPETTIRTILHRQDTSPIQPAHFPVLVDFWTVEKNRGMGIDEAWTEINTWCHRAAKGTGYGSEDAPYICQVIGPMGSTITFRRVAVERHPDSPQKIVLEVAA